MKTFVPVRVNSDNAKCEVCKIELLRGQEALFHFQRGEIIPYIAVCNELCLSRFREKEQPAFKRLLDKLGKQIN